MVQQDNAYGTIRWKQAADGFVDFGMSFGNPDFITYAMAYGIKAAVCRAPIFWRAGSLLVEKSHAACPYSKATRGNVSVGLVLG